MPETIHVTSAISWVHRCTGRQDEDKGGRARATAAGGLRQHEEHHRLAKVAHNAHRRERHACEVASPRRAQCDAHTGNERARLEVSLAGAEPSLEIMFEPNLYAVNRMFSQFRQVLGAPTLLHLLLKNVLRDDYLSAAPRGPDLSNIRPYVVEFGPNLASPKKFWPNSGEFRAEVDQHRATCFSLQPKVYFGTTQADGWPTPATSDRLQANVGRFKSNLGRVWPTSGQLGPTSVYNRLRSAPSRPIPGQMSDPSSIGFRQHGHEFAESRPG